ncbi:MAG TPA: serine/threonine-protein kinase, partial [Polyangiaceae bacterium]|nr:serine/threonine-protein kinase [Polyangiaceae bacterium]
MAPAPSASPTVRLGRYRLLLELGEGGMARVFVAFSSGLGGFNKLVVLKVMRDELRENESSLAMFLAEARLAARMNHLNIVQTLEVGEDSGRYFICMEYLEGQTLGRLMKKTVETPLPLAARLELICQVLEALVYMHAFTDPDGTPLGLVHRDISPNNIFVTFDGTAKVLDFGVAKAAGVSHATEAGMFKGKLGYAAPEQILGNSEQRSDLFAVGVLLWELLAYRRLSQDRTQQEIVQARMAGVDGELMRKALGVPVELLQICMRAAAKRVEDRYASAVEMRDALRAYIRANNLECTSEQLRTL